MPTAGNPIQLATGDKRRTDADLAFGGARAFGIERQYAFQSGDAQGGFGYGWSAPIDCYVTLVSNGTRARVVLEGGRWLEFNLSSGGAITPATNGRGDRLERPTSATWVWIAEDGERSTFTVPDKNNTLTRISSWRTLDGYGWNATHNGGQVQTLTDTLGRTLAFTWAAGNIAAVVASSGDRVDYTYQSMPAVYGEALRRLAGVTRSRAGDPTARTIQYHYEDARFPLALTGVTDERGKRVATYTYNADARVVVSEGALGTNQHTVAYDDATMTRTVTGPLGRAEVYKFTTVSGRLSLQSVNGVATPGCPASTRSLTYTAGHITGRIDEEGRRTTHVRDAAGRETSRTEAATSTVARSIGTTWDPLRPLPTQVVEPGLTTDLTYDAQGRVLTQTETDTTGN